MLRKCSACGEEKEQETQFYQSRVKRSGYAAICKKCRKIKYMDPRVKRNRAAGLCACGRPAINGMARCEPCYVIQKRSNAELREWCRQNKMCYECRRAKAAVGYTYCDDCAARRSVRTSKHGGSAVVRQALFAAQNGLCPICSEPLLGWLRMAHAVVDHDHATGKTRGLLHGQCNMGLGCLGDSPTRLEAAAAYLRKHA